MVKGTGKAASDAFGEILESGKQAASQVSPSQIAKTAAQQITGSTGDSKVSSPEKTAGASGSEIKDLYGGTEITPQQLEEMKTQEAIKRKEGLKKTRTDLVREVIGRYQGIQSGVAQAQQEREIREKGHRLKEYESGKAGAAETIEEQQARVEEARKTPAQTPVELPKSSSKLPGLDAIQRKSTQTERKLGKTG